MAKNRGIKTEKETEEPYFKWSYGKWIKVGTLKQEQNGDKTNKSKTVRRD